MGRPRKETPFASPLPPALLGWARTRGLEVAALAARFDLPPDLESRDELAITTSALGELLEELAGLAGEPALGLKLSTELRFRRYSLPELAARSSATVRDALQVIARFAPLLHPDAQIQLEERDGEARLRHRARGWPRGLGRHLEELFLAKAIARIRDETGRPATALRVWFPHARPREVEPLERYFGTCELDFGREDAGLALPRAALDWPTRAADPMLHATAVALAEQAVRPYVPGGDLAARVAEVLGRGLPDGATLEAAAAELRLSPRTLQRRLEEAGASFSGLLDQVREQRAREWIADEHLPLAEIAFRLGFSDLATFSRAFKRWTGRPPGSMRKRSSAGE